MSGGPLTGARVAVVGGGLAGISAALECSDLGATVTLLERQRRLGGLTWSFERDGVMMDNGQHVFLSCCDAYIGFLHRIGAAGDARPPRPLDIPVVAPGSHHPVVGRLRRRGLPVPFHLAGSLLTFPHLGRADRLGLGRALAGLARLNPDDPALDRTTFGEWLAARGQSAEAVAAVWDLITVPTVNLPAAEASLAAAAMVFRTGVLGRPSAVDMGWSAVPLGRIHGERAGAALERAGVAVHTGWRAEAVTPDHPVGAPEPEGWRVHGPDGTVRADAVVVALSHEEAATVVPEQAAPKRGSWAALGSSAVVDVHLVFDRKVTDWEVMAGHGCDVQWVFDRTEASGLDRLHPGRQYLAVSLSAADHLLAARPEVLVASMTESLGRLLPGARTARLVDSVVTKERRATFRCAPGTAALRPPPATACPGLVLAGAWTATGWPATMEGAVRSGTAAARALASSSPSLTAHRIQEVA